MNEQLESHKREYICINKEGLKLLIISIALLFVGYKCIVWLNTDSMSPKIYRTNVTNGKDSIFVTYYVGGFLGDVHELIISNRIIMGDKKHYIIYNPDSVFVLIEKLPIFYKFYNDTLLLYVNEDVTQPKHFESNIKVITYDISNSDEYRYYKLESLYEKSLKKIENNGNVLSMPY